MKQNTINNQIHECQAHALWLISYQKSVLVYVSEQGRYPLHENVNYLATYDL